MENKSWVDKLFGSKIFWIIMGLQAAGTGGVVLAAVTMDIYYMGETDSPRTSFVAVSGVFAVPVVCFSFVFAGAAFFNAFHLFFSPSKLSLSTANKIKVDSCLVPQDVQSLV